PNACAPSTSDMMPRDRAAAQISAAGSTSPELLLTCVMATSLVRGVNAFVNRSTYPSAPGCDGGVGTDTTVNPNRAAFRRQALRLLGWLSDQTTTSSPLFRSSPLDTTLLLSVVLRVMTISSGVTRSASASSPRDFSRPFAMRSARTSGDGLAS